MITIKDIAKFNKIKVPKFNEELSIEALKLYSYIRSRFIRNDCSAVIHSDKFIALTNIKYVSYLKELFSCGLVTRVGGYEVGNHSYSYALTEKALNTPHIWFDIKAKTRVRKPVQLSPESSDLLRTGSEHLANTFSRVSLADSIIPVWEQTVDPDRYNHMRHSIVDILQGNISQSISSVVGRNYHTISLACKELRDHILIDGEETVELDVKTLFPMLLSSYYGKEVFDKEEEGKYKDALENDFYAQFEGLNLGLRLQVKIAFNSWLNGGRVDKIDGYMKKEYPSLYVKLDRVDGAIGVSLMKLESGVMIGELGTWCEKNNIDYIPIHDGCLVKISDEKRVADKIYSSFFDSCGIIVSITSSNENFKFIPFPLSLPDSKSKCKARLHCKASHRIHGVQVNIIPNNVKREEYATYSGRRKYCCDIFKE